MDQGHNTKIRDELIFNFFAGRCSKAEQELVVSFFEENPKLLDAYFDYTDKVADESVDLIPSSSTIESLDLVHQKINKRRTRRRIAWSSGLLVCIVLFFILFVKPTTEKANISIANSVVMVEHVNNNENKERIKLPDSSIITLFPNSKIRYVQGFVGKERNIRLDGEADFKVAKDPLKPFIVVANNIATKAIGTEFKVKTSEGKVLVRLYEGKVVVWNKTDNLAKYNYLIPGFQVLYNVSDGSFQTMAFGNHNKSEKRSNKISPKSQTNDLYFTNVPMQSVLDDLAKVYNVNIEFSSKDVGNIFIIATYSSKEPIDLLLKDITVANNLELDKKGDNTYIISKK